LRSDTDRRGEDRGGEASSVFAVLFIRRYRGAGCEGKLGLEWKWVAPPCLWIGIESAEVRCKFDGLVNWR